MIEETIVAPLDAYATAKPDEPVFTLQGGDPLAGPLVRLWAFLARRRVGMGRFEEGTFAEVIEAAIGNAIVEDDRERNNLLLRATAAEEVSWAMDEYRRGGHSTDLPTEAADTHLTELQRIDLHDTKVRAASTLSNYRCDIGYMIEALSGHGYDAEILQRLSAVADALRVLSDEIEPRRIFKKD